jgi:polar amino acid transport system substrate-binding protein
MRALLEDIRISEVPEPELRPGGILVHTAYSAISAGTERAILETSEKSLLGKALARPDLVKQVLDFAKGNGLRAAYEKVRARLNALAPMGYSCSGTVIGVGEGVTEFQIGDRVACAGAGYANHSSVNWIPVNLAVKIPEGVGLDAASLTTIGAVAMQGLRQAEVSVGETVVVVGAGLIGVTTILLVRSAGCRVVAVDRDEKRIEKARQFGAQLSLSSSDPELAAKLERFSRYGADAAIVTAASSSSEPVELAARLLRDRGRIVAVGTVGLGVSRALMFEKDLSLKVSRSYGPGRYDPSYEEDGIDYPIGYVRWTEQRNMEAFLDLLASGAVDVAPLLTTRIPFEQAQHAYENMGGGETYTTILEYEIQVEAKSATPLRPLRPKTSGKLRVGCLGAGEFARGVIFPRLKDLNSVVMESVATASGIASETARRNFGFERTQTPGDLLDDPDLDAIFIATRHSTHSEYAAMAVERGKMVFVEKPLAVSREQLERMRQAYRQQAGTSSSPFLMVGFNRRFAPFTQEIQHFFRKRQQPMMIQVRVNAGYLPLDNWIQQATEGGRIIGELCHFVDWSRYLVGAPIRRVTAAAMANCGRYNQDNVAATLSFADGSVATILYAANGDAAAGKEFYEVFCEGSVARLNDFRELDLIRGGKSKRQKSARDKGHRAELESTINAMLSGAQAPIAFEEMVEVTEATFLIAEAIREEKPILMESTERTLEVVNS